jgi:hypothetical protein
MDSDRESTEEVASPEDCDAKPTTSDASLQRAYQEALESKVRAIRDACKWRDLEKLRSLALSTGGFLSDDLRKIACTS